LQFLEVRNRRAWRDLAHQGMVPAEERQYACGPCDNVWWRKVPTRKAVRLYIANVTKFVNDLRQVGGFLRVLRFFPPIKLTATI
jgi:hypothetical protein